MHLKRTWKDTLLLVLKGIGMGMANKIPGVSGGIVALAAGFYEELIFSFSRIDEKAFALLFKGRFKAFLHRINAHFLGFLFGGVALSFFSVSLLLDFFLQNHPKQVFGLFFGMIITSIYYIWKSIPVFGKSEYIGSFLGTLLGITLLWLNPGSENDHLLFVFFCGMVSISGMTLPGLSGSLLILILGNYNLLLVDAVNALYYTLIDLSQGNGLGWQLTERKRLLTVLIVFTMGSTVGMIFFAKLLALVLSHFRNLTIAILVGFIIGSLGAVWPWTNTTLGGTSEGILLTQSPHKSFFLPTEVDFSNLSTLFFIFLGATTVIILEYYGGKKTV